MTEHFLKVRSTRGYYLITTQLWMVTVHLRETDRDLKFAYANRDKAYAVAERIAVKLHEKALKREDAEEVTFNHRPSIDEFKIVWHKKVVHQGKPAYIAMKDYVYVRDSFCETVVIT